MGWLVWWISGIILKIGLENSKLIMNFDMLICICFREKYEIIL